MSSAILSSSKFAFLVIPPPKKKRAVVNNAFRAPNSPVNPSRAILAWASNVHPGSPEPMTPTFGTSLPRKASFVSSPLLQAFRRSSLTSSVGGRTPSAPLLRFADPPRTPTDHIPVSAAPYSADAKVNLTLFGYASSFVDIPVSTPITPEFYRSKRTTNRRDIPDTSLLTTPPPSHAPRMLKQLLSTKSKIMTQAQNKRAADHLDPGVSYSLSNLPGKHRTSARKWSRPAEMQKRELYAAALPLAVKQEGRMPQAVEAKAERELTTIKTGAINGVKVVGGFGTVHRDGLGGIWWDQQEESELAHLLTPTKTPLSAQYPNAEGWITYNHLKEFERENPLEPSSLPSSKHTDSYRSCPLLVTDEDAERLVRGRARRCTSIAGSMVLPSPTVESSNILLAIPSRPKRGRHLKPGFLKDVIAVPPTPTPTPPSPYSQASCPPLSPARAARFIINTSAKPGSIKRQRSRSRSLSRRKRKPVPPPLKIIPICPLDKLAVNVDPGEEEGRMQILLGDSFGPGPQVIISRWSGETTTPGLSPVRSDSQADDFSSVVDLKKSRRFGRFINKGERELSTL
jgi:hypothetical protein